MSMKQFLSIKPWWTSAIFLLEFSPTRAQLRCQQVKIRYILLLGLFGLATEFSFQGYSKRPLLPRSADLAKDAVVASHETADAIPTYNFNPFQPIPSHHTILCRIVTTFFLSLSNVA
jgi:hypothetical protein